MVNYTLLPECSCASGNQKCSKAAVGPKPKQIALATGDFVVDVSDRSYEEYVLRSTDFFLRQRYVSFIPENLMYCTSFSN